MPYQTRATGRGGGRIGTDRSRSNSGSLSPSSRLNLTSDNESKSEHNDASAPNPTKRKNKTPVILPTIHNYHEMGLDWGQSRADRILSRRSNLKTRTPPTVLFEAQSLQAQYNLDKTMLCIAEGISRSTLDGALYVPSPLCVPVILIDTLRYELLKRQARRSTSP